MLWHSLVVIFLLSLYQLPEPTPPTNFFSDFLPKSLGKFTRAHFSHRRIFMQHHKMWGPPYGTAPGLWGISAPLGPGLCRILYMYFREFIFSVVE